MEEREAHYIVEYLYDIRQTVLGGYRIGDPHIAWVPGETPQSRKCQVLLPTIGARSAGDILAALSKHLGNQREIEVCSAKRNVWVGKFLCPPIVDYKVGVYRADWSIAIWTEDQMILPSAASYFASDALPQVELPVDEFDSGRTYLDEGDYQEVYEASESDVEEAQSSEDDLIIDEVRKRARKISSFIAEHRMAHDVLVFPIHYGPTPAKSCLLYSIHGIASTFAALGLAQELVKEFTFINAVGLQELNDEHRERGWDGNYVIQVASR
jgi:hypothetical protein